MPAPQRRRPGDSQRRRGDDDGTEFEVRKKKAVAMNPMVAITIFFIIPGVMVAVLAGVYFSKKEAIHAGTKGEKIVEDENKEYKQFKKDVKAAMLLSREAIKLSRDDERAEEFKEKITLAKDTIGELLDRIDSITASVRDPKTGELPQEYSGYERDYNELQTAMVDLLKSSPMDW